MNYRAVWLLIIGCGLSEVGLRLSGAMNFPLHDANTTIGYIPKANQSGSFLHQKDWSFNNRNMIGTPYVATRGATLLIGDSIVAGGNPVGDPDRLSVQMQRLSGKRVWGVGAGGWALRNELTYLRQNPDVVADVEKVVFVLNSEDFMEGASWACEWTTPTKEPLLATYFVVRKHLFSFCPKEVSHMQMHSGDWQEELRSFLGSAKGKKVEVFLYPTLEELKKPDKLAALIRFSDSLKRQGVREVFSVASDPRWSAAFYRDAIHPTAAGNHGLAEILVAPDQRARL